MKTKSNRRAIVTDLAARPAPVVTVMPRLLELVTVAGSVLHAQMTLYQTQLLQGVPLTARELQALCSVVNAVRGLHSLHQAMEADTPENMTDRQLADHLIDTMLEEPGMRDALLAKVRRLDE